MKILVLGSRIPWPLHDGGAMATYRMLKGLAEAGAEITYFTYNTKKHFQLESSIQQHFPFCKVIPFNLDATPTKLGALLALLTGKNYNISRFESAEASTAVAALCAAESFDCIHVEGLFAFPLISQLGNSGIPIILRQHNVEFEIWNRLAASATNPLKKWYLGRLARGLKTYETAAVNACRYVVAITESDASVFRAMNPKASVVVSPGGIEVNPGESVTAPAEYSLCHIGSMEWRPNQEGVQWFIRNIWPSVLKQYPQAQFHLAGKGLNPSDPNYAAEGVVNHGEVASATDFMNAYTALVVPLHSGSGLRMKTIEAMALGKLVITTSVGMQGLEANPNTHILRADTLEEWLQAVQTVFGDKETAAKIAQDGKSWALENFSYQSLATALLKEYKIWLKK